VACDCPLLAAGAVAGAVNDEALEVSADDVPVLDDAALVSAVELPVTEVSVDEVSVDERSVDELSVAELLAETTVSMAAWANPTVTPAVARAAAPITPTVTSRTLRRSARPDGFWLPWIIGKATSQRCISASDLTPFTLKYRTVGLLCGSRPATERTARLYSPMVQPADGGAMEERSKPCGATVELLRCELQVVVVAAVTR
jgi:hypothetical protein